MIECLIRARRRPKGMRATTEERERKDKMFRKKIYAGLLAAAPDRHILFANTVTARAEESLARRH